jgi:hypothetical protein
VDGGSGLFGRSLVLEKGQVAYKGAKSDVTVNDHCWSCGYKDMVATCWTRLLDPTLRNIDVILEVGLAPFLSLFFLLNLLSSQTVSFCRCVQQLLMPEWADLP